jgi:hypothetical protein
MGQRYPGKTERRNEPESPSCSAGDCKFFYRCEEEGVCLRDDEAEALAENEADARREDRELDAMAERRA